MPRGGTYTPPREERDQNRQRPIPHPRFTATFGKLREHVVFWVWAVTRKRIESQRVVSGPNLPV